MLAQKPLRKCSLEDPRTRGSSLGLEQEPQHQDSSTHLVRSANAMNRKRIMSASFAAYCAIVGPCFVGILAGVFLSNYDPDWIIVSYTLFPITFILILWICRFRIVHSNRAIVVSQGFFRSRIIPRDSIEGSRIRSAANHPTFRMEILFINRDGGKEAEAINIKFLKKKDFHFLVKLFPIIE